MALPAQLKQSHSQRDQLPFYHQEQLRTAVNMENEKILLGMLNKAFQRTDRHNEPQSLVCAQEDLVNRVASKGWHQSLKILLDNKCWRFDDNHSQERDNLMWVVAISANYPQCVQTVMEYMVNTLRTPDEYNDIAHDICRNHPHLWPCVSAMFSLEICDKVHGWANIQEHSDPKILLLWTLDKSLKSFGNKDLELKVSVFERFLKKHNYNYDNGVLFDIAQCAVKSNLNGVFGIVQHIFESKHRRANNWAMDLSYVDNNYQTIAKQAVDQRAWKTLKLSMAYEFNTDLANTLLIDLVGKKTVLTHTKFNIDTGVALWIKNHNWNWINRLYTRNPSLTDSILWGLPFEAVVKHFDNLGRHPRLCEILHGRWHPLTANEKTEFCNALFLRCSSDYQTSFTPKSAPIDIVKDQEQRAKFQQRLYERQQAIKRPTGVFDTVISGFANPKKN